MSIRVVMTAAAGYTLVGALDRALGLVIMPITTRLFEPADFAQLLAISNITSLLNLTVGLFLVRGLPALLAAQPDDGARRDAATTVFVGSAMLGTMLLASIWMLAPWLSHFLSQPDSFAGYLRLAMTGVFVLLLGQSLLATARSLEHHRDAICALGAATLVMTASLLALLLIARAGLASIFIAALMSSATLLFGMLLTTRGWIKGRPRRLLAVQASRVSVHLLALNVGTLIILNSAGLILNWTGHANEAAAFSIASGAAALGLLATSAFDSAWTPHVLRRIGEHDLPLQARRVFELHSAAFLLAGAAGALFAHEVFALLVGPRFVDAYVLVPPLIGCYALYAFANNFMQGILVAPRPERYAWIGAVCAVAFFVLAIPGAQVFGAKGLIAAMACAFALQILLTQLASYATLPIAYPWGKHAALWGIAAVTVGWAAVLPLGWTTAGVKAVILAALAGGILATNRPLADQILQILGGRHPIGGKSVQTADLLVGNADGRTPPAKN